MLGGNTLYATCAAVASAVAATAAGAADAVVVMGYDYKTGTSANAGSVSPIGGPTYDLNDTLAAYVSRIPASKVILGVPYYVTFGVFTGLATIVPFFGKRPNIFAAAVEVSSTKRLSEMRFSATPPL